MHWGCKTEAAANPPVRIYYTESIWQMLRVWGGGGKKGRLFSLSSVLRCAIHPDEREQGRRSTADDLESEVPTNQTNRYALGGPGGLIEAHERATGVPASLRQVHTRKKIEVFRSATGRGVVPVCYMNKPGPTSQCPRGRW